MSVYVYIYIYLCDLTYMMREIRYGIDSIGRSQSTSRWKDINSAIQLNIC